MQIDPTSGAGAAGAQEAPLPTSEADKLKTQFLNMLVTELKHQDPLKPQSSAEMVQQLAQLSTIEQIAATNARLEMIEAQQATMTGTALGSLVGRNTVAAADHILVQGNNGEPPPLELRLERPAETATIIIRDDGGNEVHRIEVNPHNSSGPMSVEWDGKGPDGLPLKDGHYDIEVVAKDVTGAPVTGRLVIHGPLDAIEFSSGNPYLRFGAFTVTPADVVTLGM